MTDQHSSTASALLVQVSVLKAALAEEGFTVVRTADYDDLVKALEKIQDFPYVGEKAAQQMALIARAALSQVRA